MDPVLKAFDDAAIRLRNCYLALADECDTLRAELAARPVVEDAPRMDLAERLRAAELPSPEERRHIRLTAGVSLREFADELGVEPTTVQRWERGDAEPRRDHAIAYRKLLDAVGNTGRTE